jgi:MoxR-like ATPase
MNATETLDCILNFPIEIAILLVADQEMGKSSIVRKASQLMGGQLIDFRLSQNDVVDLKGGMAVKNGRTIFFPPEGIPLDKSDADHLKELFGVMEGIAIGNYGEKGILLLDEANRADRPVQQCAFQWIYDRCLNFRKLPSG